MREFDRPDPLASLRISAMIAINALHSTLQGQLVLNSAQLLTTERHAMARKIRDCTYQRDVEGLLNGIAGKVPLYSVVE